MSFREMTFILVLLDSFLSKAWVRNVHKSSIRFTSTTSIYNVKNNIDYDQLVPENFKWNGNLNDIRSLVIYEDKNILVVYKPPTVLTQPDKQRNDNLFDACKRYIARNNDGDYLGLVHRIDRPCSGLLLFSKTAESTAIMNEKFKRRTLDKNYLGVVNGEVKESISCHHKILKTLSEKTKVFDLNVTRNDVVDAKLRFRPLEFASIPQQKSETSSEHVESTKEQTPTSPKQTLVEIQLQTGRKHQIRAQLSYLGYPLVGDVKYGAPQSFRYRDISLHAFSLDFNHPVSNKLMQFRVGVPKIWGKRFGSKVVDASRALVEKIPKVSES